MDGTPAIPEKIREALATPGLTAVEKLIWVIIKETIPTCGPYVEFEEIEKEIIKLTEITEEKFKAAIASLYDTHGLIDIAEDGDQNTVIAIRK
jgi:hypothetical protein|nr:MAG TPA: hypothetical protein [Caudoviricetes sp.]